MGTSVSHHGIVAQAEWAEWSCDSRPYSVGVEEEVMLLDPEKRWAPAQRIDDVLERLPASLAGYVSAETHQAAIELRTDPHESVAGLSPSCGGSASIWPMRLGGWALPPRAPACTRWHSGQIQRSHLPAATA